MARLAPSFCAALSFFIFTSSPAIKAQEVSKYDEGPFAGMGYPYSESARVGDLLFLSGQAGEDHEGKLVPGGIKAEAEQLMLNIEAALARRGLTLKTL
jgi:enamine deaminase RidA (YjgF/YER057c/UK114 family)